MAKFSNQTLWTMKTLISLIISVTMATAACAQFRAMTYNIKYDDKNDTINNWQNRRDVIVGLIDFHQVTVLGVQEALHHQIQYLQQQLTSFEVIGIGREGGKQGEYSAIFYQKDKLEVLEQNTFWLSSTPQQVSIGWDAALPRICTWAKFQNKDNGKEFYLFNTHFDHAGIEARLNSAKLLITKIKLIAGNSPVVFMGDLNFTPDKAPYAILTDQGNLKDSYAISKTKPYGLEGTFNAFYFCDLPTRRIDYIFVNNGIEINQYGVLTDNYGLKYPSDHFPVMVEVNQQ